MTYQINDWKEVEHQFLEDGIEVEEAETIGNDNSNESKVGLSHSAFPPSVLYKALCIDYYIKKYECQIIASEFRYGINQLVTDLVLLTPRNIISIEVKTESDDLRRLNAQVSEARKNFNFTIVFASSKHKSELVDLLPSDVGITILENGSCKHIRAPKRNNPLASELVASMPATFLRAYYKLPQNLDSDRIRLLVLKEHKQSVYGCLRTYLKQKYSDNYQRFLLDRGEKTHIEDIPILNMKNSIDIR